MDGIQQVTLGGCEVGLVRSLGGEGIPIVFLGAWPQSLRGWGGVVEVLPPNTPWVAMDLPGFGLSGDLPASDAVVGPQRLSLWLGDTLKSLGLGPVDLVAPDVAVPVALSLAGESPELFRSLVLSDGPGTWPASFSWDLNRMAKSAFTRWLFALDPRSFVATAAKRGFVKGNISPDTLAHYQECYSKPGRLKGTLSFLSTYPMELPVIHASLPKLSLPTLALWGGADFFVLPENARHIAECIPSATLEILDGVGHFSHEDAPIAYGEALNRWRSTLV